MSMVETRLVQIVSVPAVDSMWGLLGLMSDGSIFAGRFYSDKGQPTIEWRKIHEVELERERLKRT